MLCNASGIYVRTAMDRSRYQPVYLIILEMLAAMLPITEFVERLRELWMAGKAPVAQAPPPPLP